MQTPYLEGALKERFDAWLSEARERFMPPLTVTEIRKGVQALSYLYVEKRVTGKAAARVMKGEGKRAALATFFAPLHFLALARGMAEIEREGGMGTVTRLHDLGCGSGATGAALAACLPRPPRVIGTDIAPWVLAQARATYDAFVPDGRAQRGALPSAMPRTVAGDLLVFGWSLNELEDDVLRSVKGRLVSAMRRGTGLLIAEPLSTRITPWWQSWRADFEPLGVKELLVREEIERPEWIALLDQGSGLDHRVVGCRILWKATD